MSCSTPQSSSLMLFLICHWERVCSSKLKRHIDRSTHAYLVMLMVAYIIYKTSLKFMYMNVHCLRSIILLIAILFIHTCMYFLVSHPVRKLLWFWYVLSRSGPGILFVCLLFLQRLRVAGPLYHVGNYFPVTAGSQPGWRC